MKICPQCQKKYDDASIFCLECGSDLITLQPPTQTDGSVERERFCTKCGTKIPMEFAFCPKCGKPVAGGARAFGGTQRANDAFEQTLKRLKAYFLSPGKTIDKILGDGDFTAGILPGAALLISSIIFFLCLSGKLQMEFGIGSFYGIGVLLSFLLTLFFVLFPTVAGLATAKLNGENQTFLGTVNAAVYNTVPISVLAFFSGLFGLVSIKLFIFSLVLIIAVWFFLSISFVDHVSGSVFKSSVALWISFIIQFLLIAIAGLILYSVGKSFIKDALYSLW